MDEPISPAVVVVGSTNMDLVVRADRIPSRGETILGRDFITVPGGKGANQAVAAARLGAHVVFVTRLGDDPFAAPLRQSLEEAGVDMPCVLTTGGEASGVALITVDDDGDNAIVVAPGANARLTPDDVRRARRFFSPGVVVVAQLEVPLEAVRCAAECAVRGGAAFVLDPAPARELDDDLLTMVDVIKPNETEASILTGVDVCDVPSAGRAAERLLDRGVGSVIITMGARGCLLATRAGMESMEGLSVRVVDTTAAGDAFTGGLATALAMGRDVREAALMARAAAALSVTGRGAQCSMPRLEEVMELLSES